MKYSVMKQMFRFLKGRIWCLTFHAPVIRTMGGYGGVSAFGFRRRAYHGMWCVKCENRWEQKSFGEPCIGSHIWHWRRNERHREGAGAKVEEKLSLSQQMRKDGWGLQEEQQ